METSDALPTRSHQPRDAYTQRYTHARGVSLRLTACGQHAFQLTNSSGFRVCPTRSQNCLHDSVAVCFRFAILP